jgi:hypothetical protein
MSSVDVRTYIKDFLAANSTEKIIDMTGQYDLLQDLIESQGITQDDPWVGLDFIGNEEIPITIGSSNISGKFRETGAVYIHVVDVAKLGVSDTILTRGEALRTLFRGQKIDRLFIESMTPVNFGAGAALRFEDGYMCGSFILGYLYDRDL